MTDTTTLAPTGRDDFVNIVRLIESHHGITAAQKENTCAPTP